VITLMAVEEFTTDHWVSVQHATPALCLNRLAAGHDPRCAGPSPGTPDRPAWLPPRG